MNFLNDSTVLSFLKCIYKETYRGHKTEIWVCNYFCDTVTAIYDIATSDTKNPYADDYHQRKRELIKKRTAFFIYGITDGSPHFVSSVEYSSKEILDNVARICARVYSIPQHRNQESSIAQHRGRWKTVSPRVHHFINNVFIEIPQYMQMYGFDIGFFTRHYNPKRPNKNSMNHLKKIYGHEGVNFNQLETPKIYRGVPQTIYYMGNDPTIFDGLPDYEIS